VQKPRELAEFALLKSAALATGLLPRLRPTRQFEWSDWRTRKRPSRIGETLAFDVTQDGNNIKIQGDGLDIYYSVEGIMLPSEVDATFAVWALLPRAMEEGRDLHINRSIDAQVIANAELLSQIWEMWVPNRYRSISVRGQGEWSRSPRVRLPQIQLFSGGIDSTFSILQNPQSHGVVATVCGIDHLSEAKTFARLIAKTEPILKHLNSSRIIIRTNAACKPSHLTHGMILASCLFLLSDLFEKGTIAADSTPAMDLVEWPWGNNHITTEYYAGSDFAVRAVGAEVTRTQKIASIARTGIDLQSLSFCRERNVIPSNCGSCWKCVQTKAMLLIATGSIPEIFIDNSFDESLMRKMLERPRTELFYLYFHAKKHDALDRIPSLVDLIEEYRRNRPEFR
jgi:hypothetical protein